MTTILIAKTSQKKMALKSNGNYEVVATPRETYYFIDGETGRTPEDVRVTRKDNDLILASPAAAVQVKLIGFWDKDQLEEQQCFVTVNVSTEAGKIGQATITQQGGIMPYLVAGEIGTVGKQRTITSFVSLLNAVSTIGKLADNGEMAVA